MIFRVVAVLFSAVAMAEAAAVERNADMLVWEMIEMPKKSAFLGLEPPTDETKWEQARILAGKGEQVLLKRVVAAVKNPLELIKGKISFKDVHRMGDVFLSKASGGLKKLSQYKPKRAPIVLFGYRDFTDKDHEGREIRFNGFHTDSFKVGELPRKMVVIGSMDENWGYFSTVFRNRTAGWGMGYGPYKADETKTAEFEKFLRKFLDDPNVLMVLSNQHHNITHPKVLSYPLGLYDPRMDWDAANRVLRRDIKKDTGKKVMFTAGSDWGPRPLIRKCVERNLGSAIDSHGKKNGEKNPFTPFQFKMKLASSISILCMPGFGYDTYRLWETLTLGSMPVIEKGVGLERSLWKLPALFVDDYADVTADMIREAYVEAIYRADEWEYERLTMKFWRDTVFEVTKTENASFMLERHPMSAVDEGFTRPLVYYNCEKMGGCGKGTLRTPKTICKEFEESPPSTY